MISTLSSAISMQSSLQVDADRPSSKKRLSILTLIDLVPLVTVIGFFQAPER